MTAFRDLLTASLPDGPPAATMDVALDLPRITCDADNSLTLALRLRGSFSATFDGVDHERTIDGHLGIRLRPRFFVSGRSLVLSPEPEDVTVFAVGVQRDRWRQLSS